MPKRSSVPLLTDSTTQETGEKHTFWGNRVGYHGIGSTSSGTGAAVVVVEISNNNVNWETLATFTLTLGTVVTGGVCGSVTPWQFTRARVVSISGTGAKVSVFASVSGAR